MTRNTLLKKYEAEIERLKADSLTAHENKMFFEETWNWLSTERELGRMEIPEVGEQVEIVEGQIEM
jgi:hypothetical protein